MKAHLTELLFSVVKQITDHTDSSIIVIDRPKIISHGDFSTNICLVLSKSLKKGGRFIGTCLNGEEVFNNLKGNDIISSTDDVISWKITKKYTQTNFSPSDASLGMEIDVYNESIGITFPEYLVNMDYLTMMCKRYNLELVENSSFETVHSTISTSQSYGKIKDMTDDHKKYSFMNNYFVYEKSF